MREIAKLSIEGYRLTPCIYCGQVANCKDHFVPRAYRAIIENWRKQEGWEDVPDTVPCCGECNGIAGTNVFATIVDKRQFIHDRLRVKHRRALLAPPWGDEELEELGYSLRSKIIKGQLDHIKIVLRLSWPYESELEALVKAEYRKYLAGSG